jgi:hypothetical protein
MEAYGSDKKARACGAARSFADQRLPIPLPSGCRDRAASEGTGRNAVEPEGRTIAGDSEGLKVKSAFGLGFPKSPLRGSILVSSTRIPGPPVTLREPGVPASGRSPSGPGRVIVQLGSEVLLQESGHDAYVQSPFGPRGVRRFERARACARRLLDARGDRKVGGKLESKGIREHEVRAREPTRRAVQRSGESHTRSARTRLHELPGPDLLSQEPLRSARNALSEPT